VVPTPAKTTTNRNLMGAFTFTTPVLLLVFNRPKTTKRVLESLRFARGPILYVAADGPRAGTEADAERCEEARRIATAVDWPCEVHTRFQKSNLGCGQHVSSAISWYFEHVPEGIILEDDCVPSVSFYRFCQELLGHFRADPRIMHVSGNSHQYGRRRGDASYYFSRYANFWGWATWSRAWKHYDFNLRPSWELRDTWDTQWQLSIERAGGLSIVPNVNLVTNIGFGPGATHTKGQERGALAQAEEMDFPLLHPRGQEVNRAADAFTYYVHHRVVRHVNFVWVYQLQDVLVAKMKAAKKMILRRLGIGR
jgi:hypothetical protein